MFFHLVFPLSVIHSLSETAAHTAVSLFKRIINIRLAPLLQFLNIPVYPDQGDQDKNRDNEYSQNEYEI